MDRLLGLAAPALCAACAAHAGSLEPLCAPCRGELRWLGREPAVVSGTGLLAWAPLAYAGPARALVRRLKFGSAFPLAATMAAQIVATAPPGLLAGAALVPVPLHPSRLRSRGFNQAERIASAIGARAGLEVVDCLERVGSGATQVGRGRSARMAGIDGGVRVRPGTEAPRRALLVDDVITTGATLAACARALREAGADPRAAIAYARTPGR
jgi:ComF family protein